MKVIKAVKSLCPSVAFLGFSLIPLYADIEMQPKEMKQMEEEMIQEELPAHSSLFGYVSGKAGYSHESFSKTIFSAANVDKSAYLKGSSASVFPLGVSVGFGYGFTPNFGLRVEAEYIYRFGGKFKKDELYSTSEFQERNEISVRPQMQIQSLLGNLYLDYYLTPSINLYVSTGVGVGFAKSVFDYMNSNSNKGGVLEFSSKSAIWQVGLGIGYAITNDFGLDFNLRYVDFGKVKFESTNDIPASASIPFSTIEVLFAFIYRF